MPLLTPLSIPLSIHLSPCIPPELGSTPLGLIPHLIYIQYSSSPLSYPILFYSLLSIISAVYLSSRSLHASIYVSTCLSIYLSVRPSSIYQYIVLSIYPSISLYLHISIYLSIYLSIFLHRVSHVTPLYPPMRNWPSLCFYCFYYSHYWGLRGETKISFFLFFF